MPVSKKEMENLKKSIDSSMNDMYGSVYYSNPSLAKTLSYMRVRSHRAIDGLMNSNISNIGATNISSLIIKADLQDMQSNEEIIQAISTSMENETLINSIMQSYTQNSWIRDMDREVDMICKYMNKLEQALDCRREHVLCSDNFTNTNLHIRSRSAIGNDITSAKNIETMKKKYNLSVLLDKVYRKIDKYGECFVYIVPYKRAISRLLKQQGNAFGDMPTVRTEGIQYVQQISESFIIESSMDGNEIDIKEVSMEYHQNQNIVFEMDHSGLIQSTIIDHDRINSILTDGAKLSLNESVLSEAIEKRHEPKAIELDKYGKKAGDAERDSKKTVEDEFNKKKDDFYKLDNLAQDGVHTLGDFNKRPGNTSKIKIPGAVIKILERDMVKPLYIEDVCIGYFYIECDKRFDIEHTTFSSTIGGIRPGGMYRGKHKDVYFRDSQENQFLKRLALAISRKIDSSFVNANQDLAKEIYAILKYNSTINMDGKIARMRVTFIPPEDMVHCFFEQDDETKRGISAILKGLFPAKLWTCLLISNTLSILTRGNDKRVYYVTQNVDTNIAATMINTINQIHRGNFGIRQIESMNNVLNILGRFNDLLVPKSPSGDSPLQIETIPAQNVDIKTDLMNMLEEVVVQSTGVPFDYTQALHQTDFATRLTMTNTRFLQLIYNLQALTKSIFSKILTKIYNAEFETAEEIEYVPNTPTYLMCINTAQILNGANDIAENIANMYIPDDVEGNDVVKARVVGELKKKYTSLFFPSDDMEELIARAKMEAKKDQLTQSQDNQGSDEE